MSPKPMKYRNFHDQTVTTSSIETSTLKPKLGQTLGLQLETEKSPTDAAYRWAATWFQVNAF